MKDNLKLKYGVGSVEGYTAKDTVYLTDGIEIKKQIFGAITKSTSLRSFYDGILGKQFRSKLT